MLRPGHPYCPTGAASIWGSDKVASFGRFVLETSPS